MKKVLILAYDFPPYNSIGGQRPYSWLKYFKEFDLDPIVVTRHWDRDIKQPEDCYQPSISQKVEIEESAEGTVIRAPFKPSIRDHLISKTDPISKLTRKGLSAWQLATEHSLSSSDNRNGIYEAAYSCLKENKVDCIVATGEPFILFTHAAKLSSEFSIPWIADYRDGWSANYHQAEGGIQNFIQQNILKPTEKKLLESASGITVAAPTFSNEIKSLSGRDCEVIYNGFFHEKFAGISPSKSSEKVIIAHAGTVYPYQKVQALIDGLREFTLNTGNQQVEVIFYGLNFQPDQVQRIKILAKDLPVKFVDRMPHDQMLNELANCSATLLLATPEKAQIYAKVFDYMAIGKPIILVENDKGPLEEMLDSNSQNHLCSNSGDVVSALRSICQKSTVEMDTGPKPDLTFSRQHQTGRMANYIKKIIA